jgi:hypothetical protein
MADSHGHDEGSDVDLRGGPALAAIASRVGPAAGNGEPFDDVKGRRSADVLLQVMTQDLTTLSGQADIKASILITAASIVVSVSLTATRYKEVRWALATLSVFALVALANAILAVLPRGKPIRAGEGIPATPFNPLYFAHAARVDSDAYVETMAGVLREDASIYEAVTRQVHSLAYHLEHRKFAHLRRAYAWFLSGFVAAGVAQLITLMAH